MKLPQSFVILLIKVIALMHRTLQKTTKQTIKWHGISSAVLLKICQFIDIMSRETLCSSKLLARYNKVILTYKKISKVIGLDRALDSTFEFNVFRVVDYVLPLHYICSVVYIIITKFDDKIQVLRPLTLCPLAVQV